jgi:ATP-dependent helicase/nuclease subunit A
MTSVATPTDHMAYTPESDDALARQRIRTDLDVNMLVEAGAGSGKTTSLVGRMLALVERGTPVDQIAAVTFTRKAANELRERFQLELERRARTAEAGSEQGQRVAVALRDLDRAFLGTVHSFSARLLRERPLEVDLDPNFEEVSEEDWAELQRTFWNRWLELVRRADDPALAELHAVGVDPRALYKGFKDVVTYPDVDFELRETAAPDVAACRRKLRVLLDRARQAMPREEPEDGWDKLMGLVRRLDFHARIHDWEHTADFCAAIEPITKSQCDLTQKRWGATTEAKKAAKALSEDFLAWLEADAADVLRCWREHRYPAVMRFLQSAAADFARERHATGRLGFEDLLLLSARLLRENPTVRDELGERYRYLLVDEFQDTDPVQAEVCFLLASPSSEGSDWRRVTPRAGALFVVGDPKQSIYRFRRADIQVYELVKARLEACGDVLALTRNFRSAEPIGTLVNAHFRDVFPQEASAEQAPFRPMLTSEEATGRDGVYRYAVRPEKKSNGAIVAEDAACLATWIAGRVERGERDAGDFLVLTADKAPIAHLARALAERNVPVATTGAKLPQERELTELIAVLRALEDPENAVRVAAVLEGLFFGCSPADLYDGRAAGLHFGVTHRPAEAESLAGRALLQLHEWWKVSQRQPADVLVERILDDTGLLAYAAGQPLGDARAGALLHVVETLREVSVAGAAGLTDAIAHLELLLEQEAPDAPLRPGRADAVRVMNVHKAKGLEATVVVLAAPKGRSEHAPMVYVRRGEGDRAIGGIVISDDQRPIAQPAGWAEMEAAESVFAEAERARLLYVAATRAKRELVVARLEWVSAKGEAAADKSAWSPLAPALDRFAADISLAAEPAPGRRVVERTADSMREAVEAAAVRVQAASMSSVTVATVTEAAKADRDDVRSYDLPAATSTGAAWGRAVHRALEGLGRGREGDGLRAFVAAVARDEGLTGEQATRLERLVAEVRASDAWRRLSEHGAPHFELPVMRCTAGDGGSVVVREGVVDAAAQGDDGWVVVDWKTDNVDDKTWAERRERYTRQVESYAEILAALTGGRAEGRVERLQTRAGS